MASKLYELVRLARRLPDANLDSLIKAAQDMAQNTSAQSQERAPCRQCGTDSAKQEATAQSAQPSTPAPTVALACPHCHSQDTVRYGRKSGKQRFLCKKCGKTYGTSTNTLAYRSQLTQKLWEEVQKDTLDGLSIEKTRIRLNLSHDRVFYMRHKILMGLQQMERIHPTRLAQVCEIDATYVLENQKGTKLPADYWRSARKHGAVASKCGVSQERICLNTGVQRTGAAWAISLNRATPDPQEAREAFAGHIQEGSLILCDGQSSYETLGKSLHCSVMNVQKAKAADETGGSFYHINTVNSFHSLIKRRYVQYGGVATKYLNRYSALFARAFRAWDKTMVDMRNLLALNAIPCAYNTRHDVKTSKLLCI